LCELASLFERAPNCSPSLVRWGRHGKPSRLAMDKALNSIMVSYPQPRLLLIEDDRELSEQILEMLRREGYAASHVATGSEALTKALNAKFDLLLVDRMIPETDGLSVIRTLRDNDIFTPALVISALGEVDERVRGLRSGADDYLIKPFSFIEMGARIEALLRRPHVSRSTLVSAGPFRLDLFERTISLDDKLLELTEREYQILEYFLRRPGQIVTRDMLIEQVWRLKFSPQTNVVDVHIHKLRRKIDGARENSFIRNVRGQGFMFHDQA
jgi:two-component system, OmpR family, response regulator